jgi:hypothetical protein
MDFTVVYRGNPPVDGNRDAPATAMARGVGVVQSGDTIVEAPRGSHPWGFLNSLVTTDGPSYEEDMHIGLDRDIMSEVKVSDGKVQVIGYQDGVEYISAGNVKSGVTLAVDEILYMAADGEFTDNAEATAGDLKIGVVKEINKSHMGETTAFVWQARVGLGVKA